MYFLGLVHGRPSTYLDLILKKGYSLTREQLRDIVPFVLYAPITLEVSAPARPHQTLVARSPTYLARVVVQHSGVFEAFADAKKVTDSKYDAPTREMVIAQMEKNSKSNLTHTIVGHVVDYFEVPLGGFYVIYQIHSKWQSVIWMITNGKSSGLSMTHFPIENGGTSIMPYEVSLCFEPARPHCYSVVGSPTLMGVLTYKRRLISGIIGDLSERLGRPSKVLIMADMDMDKAAPAPTNPLQDALSSIPDEGQRTLVAARLSDMMKHVDAKEKEHADMLAEKEKLANELKAASQQNTNARVQTELLKAQLNNVTTNLGKERCQRYNLTPDVTNAAIESRDYDQLADVAERTLMACSRLMMEQADSVSSGPKRSSDDGQLTPAMAARIDEIGSTMAAAAPAAAPAAAAAPAPTPMAASAAGPAEPAGLVAASAGDMGPDDYLARAMAWTGKGFREGTM